MKGKKEVEGEREHYNVTQKINVLHWCLQGGNNEEEIFCDEI